MPGSGGWRTKTIMARRPPDRLSGSNDRTILQGRVSLSRGRTVSPASAGWTPAQPVGLPMNRSRRLMILARAHGQYGFPFPVGPAPTPIARFRRLTGPGYLPARRPFRRLATFAIMTLAWPAGALATAIRTQRRNARPGRSRRILDAWWLAMTRNVPPFDYRAYRLDAPAPRAELLHFLFWTDLRALAVLNARRGAPPRDVQDKARFAAICASHALPYPATLAVFRGGRQVAPEPPFLAVADELWVKSLDGKGGEGAASFRREGDHYRDASGKMLTAAAFAEQLSATDCIVQPRLMNHQRIADITNGALASLRIITGVDATGRASVIAAMLYLPSGARQSSIAGIGCAIERTSGTLTRALDFQDGAKEILHHPDTGSDIVGRALPHWPESLALACRAHEIGFDRFVFLGWDIALTPDGPLLLEANAGWLALHLQMLNGPLGKTDMSRILSEHL